MDEMKFLEEKKRMCDKHEGCNECPLSKINNRYGMVCGSLIEVHPEEAVSIVEKWSANHPAKTRQSELLKMFPYAPTTVENGALKICPKNVDEKRDFSCARPCSVCLKEYWFSEVE